MLTKKEAAIPEGETAEMPDESWWAAVLSDEDRTSLLEKRLAPGPRRNPRSLQLIGHSSNEFTSRIKCLLQKVPLNSTGEGYWYRVAGFRASCLYPT